MTEMQRALELAGIKPHPWYLERVKHIRSFVSRWPSRTFLKCDLIDIIQDNCKSEELVGALKKCGFKAEEVLEEMETR